MRKNLYLLQQAFKVVLFLLTVSACNPIKFSTGLRNQPKAEYYSFSKSITRDVNTLLDTSKIYVYGEDLIRTYSNGKTERVFTHNFLFFQSNGIALYSNDSRVKFNSVNIYDVGGQHCFYRIMNGEIQLEIYDSNIKNFIIMTGKILENKIQFYKNKIRIRGGGKSKQEMIFVKSSVKYMQPLLWPK